MFHARKKFLRKSDAAEHFDDPRAADVRNEYDDYFAVMKRLLRPYAEEAKETGLLRLPLCPDGNDKALLEEKEPGTLCIIIEKHGSAPRGVGSMMFVGLDTVLGSIGGGEPEYLAICHAKEYPGFSVREYTLNNTAANGLDMICGGRIRVLFIPV